jgi:hypothetical protein
MNNSCCLICEKPITPKVYEDSMTYYGVPLCFPHRRMIDESRVSPEVMKLYLGLKSNQVPVILEYPVDQKLVDIAIPGKLYLEIGKITPSQESKDSSGKIEKITRKSTEKNISVWNIPHTLLHDELQFKRTLAQITEMYLDLKKAG